MRNYRQKNKDRINGCNKERRLERLVAGEPIREMNRIRNHRYREHHRDEINIRAKSRNWNYTPEKGAKKREKIGTRYGPRVAITSARLRSQKMNLPFNLTVEWYEKEFAKGCAMTGLPLESNGSKTPWVAHVDRMVPALGYVQSNCRLVCACFNLAKKNWIDADVIKMARALVQRTSDA